MLPTLTELHTLVDLECLSKYCNIFYEIYNFIYSEGSYFLFSNIAAKLDTGTSAISPLSELGTSCLSPWKRISIFCEQQTQSKKLKLEVWIELALENQILVGGMTTNIWNCSSVNVDCSGICYAHFWLAANVLGGREGVSVHEITPIVVIRRERVNHQ